MSRRRPLSAIFLGSKPESSSSSGLPSPPATNSTGSGSTGSIRHTMSNEPTVSKQHSDNDNDDDDEDNTARLHVNTPPADSDVGTLQRVKSLAQRNRMVRSETERESQRAPTPSHRSVSPELSTTPPPLDIPPNKTRPPSPGPSRTPRKRVSMASHMSAPESRGDDIADAALAAVASSRRSPTGTGSINRRSRQPLPREFRDNRERRSLDGRPSIEPMTPHHVSYREGAPNEDISPRTAAHTAANASMSTLQYSPRGQRTNRSSTVRDLARRHQPRWLSDDISTVGSTTTGTASSVPDSGRRQAQRGGSAESPLASGRLAGEGLRAAGISMRTTGRGRYGAVTHDDDPFSVREIHAGELRRAKSGSGMGVGRVVEWEDEEHARDRRMDDERSRTSGSSVRESEGIGPPTSRGILRTEHARSMSTLVSERDARSSRPASSRPATSMGMGGGEMYRPDSTLSRSRRYDLPDRSLIRRHTSMTPVSTSSGTGSASGSVPGGSGEHTRLMVEALSMFQAALARLPGQPFTTQGQGQGRDLQYQAETLVRSADRLNALMRAGTTHAVQQQIAIEVDDANDDDYDSATRDPARIWRDVGADYREGLRESDEIVRTLTGFILGVGRVLKETAAVVAAGAEGSKEHLRCTSLDAEAMRRRTPDGMGLGSATGSRHSQDGRRSVESRRSWDPAVQGDLARRVSLRGDREYDLSRPPSSALRDRDSASDQDRRHIHSRNGFQSQSQPSSAASSSSSTGPGPRRLLTPREIREQQLSRSADAVDLSMDHEPSPTPASRHAHVQSEHRHNQNDRHNHRPTPSHATPPPLPSLPSETLLRKSSLAEKQSRRKISLASLASITTVRAASSPFALSTSSPTTAVTAHTVSGSSPEIEAAPIPASASGSGLLSAHALTRSDSRDSARSVSASSSYVTFSRPSEVSMSALQQQLQHSRDSEARAGSTDLPANANASVRTKGKGSANSDSNQLRTPLSGSETERDTRRRTIGVRSARMSLDGAIEEREGEAGGYEGGTGPGARTNTITLPSQRRERRRTVTEIFG
ncbi:hypothetical protein J3A83DRAFT_4084425 [Scleroderma citrinum]